jgi:hypothetical protein
LFLKLCLLELNFFGKTCSLVNLLNLILRSSERNHVSEFSKLLRSFIIVIGIKSDTVLDVVVLEDSVISISLRDAENGKALLDLVLDLISV